MKMEAEAVLHLIMKKLKEYKANPMRSVVQEKVRQKSLRKMFSIYTSLKKKEKAQQKQKEIIERIKENGLLQERRQEVNGIIKDEDELDIIDSSEDYVKKYEVESDNQSISNRIGGSDNLEKIENNMEMPELDTEMYIEDPEQSEQFVDAGFEDAFSPEELHNSATVNEDNQRINDQNEIEIQNNEEVDNSASVDGFLLQLGEGLKKLPYRQRSKLEIEFLARLYEVEECLGLLGN